MLANNVRFRNVYEDNEIGVEFRSRDDADEIARMMQAKTFPLRRIARLKITYKDALTCH
jgi:hypothetical protein